MVSNHPEGTFGRLRYSLGGDRPSQTVHQALSTARITGSVLEPQNSKGGIPRLTPHNLTAMLLSLPPILYMIYRISVLSCSKALWGLSVQSRVNTYLHVYFNFAGSIVETVPKSLRLSCGSEFT